MSRVAKLKRKLRHASGYSVAKRIDTDKQVAEHDILSCVHCGYSWEVIPGSGRERGFCLGGHNCPGGVTCGRPGCEKRTAISHLPAEAWLEAEEGTRHHSKIVIPVGAKL